MRLRRTVDEPDLLPETDIRGVAEFYATVANGLVERARDGASREELMAFADRAMAA